jgi:hypothetical protein
VLQAALANRRGSRCAGRPGRAVGPDSLNDLGGCLLELLHASPQQRLLGKPNREPKSSVANDELMYTGGADNRPLRREVGQSSARGSRTPSDLRPCWLLLPSTAVVKMRAGVSISERRACGLVEIARSVPLTTMTMRLQALTVGAQRRAPTHTLERLVSELLNNATSQARATSTERGWMICVVVTSGMNHQRATSYIGNFKPRCQYWIICITHGVYE